MQGSNGTVAFLAKFLSSVSENIKQLRPFLAFSKDLIGQILNDFLHKFGRVEIHIFVAIAPVFIHIEIAFVPLEAVHCKCLYRHTSVSP